MRHYVGEAFGLHVLHFIEKSLQIHFCSKYYNFRTKKPKIPIRDFLEKCIFPKQEGRRASSIHPPGFSSCSSLNARQLHLVPRKDAQGGTEMRSREGGPGTGQGLKLPPGKGDP